MSRDEAFTVLDLRGDADAAEVTRAYRRLARTQHPDAGGDVAAFHRIRRAYERLAEEGLPQERRRPAPTPTPTPSRTAASASSRQRRFDDTPVDTSQLDAEGPAGGGPGLSTAGLARLLVAQDGRGPVARVEAVSRGPGRTPGGVRARFLSDRTASLTIGPARHRGRRGHDVEVTILAWSRRDRRTLEQATRPDGWVHTRGSSTTTLARVFVPSRDARATAVRVASEVADVLDGAGWPIGDWSPRP